MVLSLGSTLMCVSIRGDAGDRATLLNIRA
jgi:hypothetical protein